MGGGLAGCEAAWALAERGVRVTLHEMRPVRMTPAHKTESLAELVCSNTFKSVEPTHAHGLLKAEMRQLGSIVLQAADEARIPGGSALAVDRVVFASDCPFDKEKGPGYIRSTIAVLESLDLKPADREKISYKNAQALFGVK